MATNKSKIINAVAGWSIMLVPVTTYLAFNFDVFTPAKVSALFMFACCGIGFSIMSRFKNIGGFACMAICVVMLVMQSAAFYVTAWAFGIFGASNFLASITFLRRSANGK